MSRRRFVELMGDLKDSRLMYLKAGLFALIGIASGAGLIAQSPTLTTVVLVLLVAWSFSRLYYFCFYVIEKYIDPTFHFDGLGSVIVYLLRNKRTTR